MRTVGRRFYMHALLLLSYSSSKTLTLALFRSIPLSLVLPLVLILLFSCAYTLILQYTFRSATAMIADLAALQNLDTQSSKNGGFYEDCTRA